MNYLFTALKNSFEVFCPNYFISNLIWALDKNLNIGVMKLNIYSGILPVNVCAKSVAIIIIFIFKSVVMLYNIAPIAIDTSLQNCNIKPILHRINLFSPLSAAEVLYIV